MKATNFNISRRALLGAGLAAPFVSVLPGVISAARAAGPVKLEFMYPVGVSGDINKIISGMIADFNAQHEGIEVEATRDRLYYLARDSDERVSRLAERALADLARLEERANRPVADSGLNDSFSIGEGQEDRGDDF